MMRWNSTKTYTEEDIMRMQQEAVNRVHEFQTRASSVSYYDTPTIGEYHEELREPEPVIEAESRVLPTPEDEAQPIPQTQPLPEPIQGLLDRFNLDSETLLIMGLLFLLYNEHADNVLLLALAYLLL